MSSSETNCHVHLEFQLILLWCHGACHDAAALPLPCTLHDFICFSIALVNRPGNEVLRLQSADPIVGHFWRTFGLFEVGSLLEVFQTFPLLFNECRLSSIQGFGLGIDPGAAAGLMGTDILAELFP